MVEFAPLIAAVRHDGGRVGWLDWTPHRILDSSRLDRAAESGLLRSVAVDARGSVAVKPRSGPPTLRDVVREHFRGCALVLVAAPTADDLEDASRRPEASSPLSSSPLLEPSDDGRWRLSLDDRQRAFDTSSVVSRLRRPRPFPELAPE